MISCIVSIINQEKLNAQNKQFNPEEKFSVDSLTTWTIKLMSEISKAHPGFYRYTNKERFNFIIDSTNYTIKDSLTTLAYYRKLKPLFAKIGCLHTSVDLSEHYKTYITKESKLIPITVFIDKDKHVFITKDYSDKKSLAIKSEIISINGKPISEIINKMLLAVPSDGVNQTLKTLLLNHRFAFWYQSIIELNKDYEIEIKLNNSIEKHIVKGVSKEIFPSLESVLVNKKQLDFKIKDSIAFLTIHSFAKTVIKKNGQNYKKFIKESFKILRNKKVKNLIIDIRYNSGGTDGNAAFLASHFFDQPFKYWDKIEVTDKIAIEIKGINTIFFKKPIQKDSTYHWRGARSWLTKEFNYYKLQKPAKDNYTGNVYIITNGLCISSCSDLVAILSHNKKATIVGQESGGGFQGNTSGMMPVSEIYANMLITIPLQKYTNAVDMNKNFGRGTIPDFIIEPTLDDWIDKKDIEMDFVIKQLKK
ncbi:S41 family peptidase [Aquimarina sp. RZ0]|uniref:S41 family peptidase n=1 Tax=Aquimarina sp. RZ0 TaxID=2607730 RepID=UPI00165F23EF|nr:S41 family peptidase [Aquimarina sp. RZ0]